MDSDPSGFSFPMATKKESYQKKLSDPRWQKKRLEILERDHFSCTLCGDNKTELQVHHKQYRGSDPWNCQNNLLQTLCAHYHGFISEFQIPSGQISKIFKSPADEGIVLIAVNKVSKRIIVSIFTGGKPIIGMEIGSQVVSQLKSELNKI